MLLFQCSSHTICSSTFLIVLLGFHRCHFLNLQISSGASSGCRHPDSREPLVIAVIPASQQMPLSLAYFPLLVEFLNVNFEVKKHFGVQVFPVNAFPLYQMQFSVSSFLLFWRPGQRVSAQSIGSRNRPRERETRENTGKLKEVRCKAVSDYTRLNCPKTNGVYPIMEAKQLSGLGRREQIVLGRYLKYTCDYLLGTKRRTEKVFTESDR